MWAYPLSLRYRKPSRLSAPYRTTEDIIPNRSTEGRAQLLQRDKEEDAPNS